jgi:hypothetical protein
MPVFELGNDFVSSVLRRLVAIAAYQRSSGRVEVMPMHKFFDPAGPSAVPQIYVSSLIGELRGVVHLYECADGLNWDWESSPNSMFCGIYRNGKMDFARDAKFDESELMTEVLFPHDVPELVDIEKKEDVKFGEVELLREVLASEVLPKYRPRDVKVAEYVKSFAYIPPLYVGDLSIVTTVFGSHIAKLKLRGGSAV